MQKEKIRTLSDIFGTVEAIKLMRANLINSKKLEKKLSTAVTKLIKMKEAGKITEKMFNQQKALVAAQSNSVGASVKTDTISDAVAFQEKYLATLLSLTPPEILPKENKQKIIEIVENKEEEINLDKVETILLEKATPEEKVELEKIKIEIDPSQPTKELVKSFKTMALAVDAAIVKLQEAIDILDTFMDNYKEENAVEEKIEAKEKESTSIDSEATKEEPVKEETVKEETVKEETVKEETVKEETVKEIVEQQSMEMFGMGAEEITGGAPTKTTSQESIPSPNMISEEQMLAESEITTTSPGGGR